MTQWILFLAIFSSVACQEPHEKYNFSSIEPSGPGHCPPTEELREKIHRDVELFVTSSVLPKLTRPCDCGGSGWRRVAYLDTSDPTQACPPAWELITTPRRSCARPSNAGSYSCYSATYPTQDLEYSQVCGRIIGYQVGAPEAFVDGIRMPTIDERYVDGVSLTYGSPRQHIWTFANALDEVTTIYASICPCTNVTQQRTANIPSYVGDDYFCETGVPPGEHRGNRFYADDPLWDGQGCGPTSSCCTFNNPPWFCKQLPQSTSADLEVRLCSRGAAFAENTPVDLIEIYIK